MNTDLNNLTMLKTHAPQAEKCPKCEAVRSPDSRECPHCGVIFQKAKTSVGEPNGGQPGKRLHPAPDPLQARAPSVKIGKLAIRAVAAAILSIFAYHIYTAHIESRIQAGGFQSGLNDFCGLEITEPHSNRSSENEEPFLTGKVLVVSPRQEVTLYSTSNGQPYTMVQPAEIHPTWFRLSRKVRARGPADIDTLIRIHKIIGKAGRYGKMMSKVFSTHKIVLNVYDWKNKTHIGTKIFDPGEGSTFMTDEDYSAMMASVSDEAIAKYIQTMEVRP